MTLSSGGPLQGGRRPAMIPPMRIALVTRALIRAGAERQLVLLAKELADRGHQVTVMVLYAGGALEAELLDASIPVVTASRSRRTRVIAPLNLARALRRFRPNVVYSFLTLPNIVAAASRPFTRRAPVVMGIRGERPERQTIDWRVRNLYRLEARFARSAAAVITNSDAAARWITARGCSPDRISVVANGIDVTNIGYDSERRNEWRTRWGMDEASVVVGRVGGLRPIKAYPTFLGACAIVARERPDARFVCVGDGSQDYREELALLADRLGLADRLVWAGEIGDVSGVLSAFDVAVSCSVSESFPNVVAEAMACGVASVVTDVGESRGIVGDTGAVVPPGDDVALARAITEAIDVAGEEEAVARHQRRERIVDHFSVAVMVDATEQVLAGASR